MPYTIRNVTPADIPAITAIYAHAVINGTASFELDPPSEADMINRMESLVTKNFPYVVAIDDQTDTLLGYAYAGSYRTRPAYRWTVENSVYLDEAAQGKGIGKALTAEIIKRCEALGFRQMVSVIGGTDNKASIAMHAALGFEHTGVLPATGFKHGKWLDTVLMQLKLGDGDSTDPV